MKSHNRLKLVQAILKDAGIDCDTPQVRQLKRTLNTMLDDEFERELARLREDVANSAK